MLKKSFATACFIAIILLNGGWVFCASSGLNAIPTADVLDKGVLSLETESAGDGQPWGDDCGRFSLLQIGVGNGIELGVDRCLNNDDPDTWINIKWRVRDDSNRLPALAFGVQGIGGDKLAQPYVALLKGAGGTRLHTGAIGIDRKIRWMFGLDRPLNSFMTLQADYISGDENSITYGLVLNLSNSLSLTLGRSSGNGDHTGNGHIVNLAWSTPVFEKETK